MSILNLFFPKKICVFSRLNISNYGDPIIADCCKYIIEKTAKEEGIRVQTKLLDVYTKDETVLKNELKNQDIVVFPGGGMNSIKFNNIVLNIQNILKDQKKTKVFFNSIGILRVNPNLKNEKLLRQIFNNPQVKQVTTRGDLERLVDYIFDSSIQGRFPAKLVVDPGIWAGEAYQVTKNKDSDVIGVGVIRPEIFEANGNDFNEEQIYEMYRGIVQELDRRNLKWQFFTNGMKEDYTLAKKLLKEMGLDQKKYLGPNVKSRFELVEKISGYKGIIAARMHANIIGTSLEIPTVGLVWNDKMNLFANMIGCGDRYIGPEHLMDPVYVIDKLEEAMESGYNTELIDSIKAEAIETIKNIVRS